MYKGIVIGCGNIGALLEADEKRAKPRTHASALLGNSKTSLAALVDVNEESLKKAKAFFPDTPAYTDLQKCLAEIRPNIAIVATDSANHASVIGQCAESGVPMIIGEKPLAHTMSDARNISAVLKKHGTTFVLNYQRRLFPLFREARELITTGTLGNVQQVTCYYSNGAHNNAGHTIDSLLFLLGERIVAVHGVLNHRNVTHPDNDPNIDGILITGSGITITLQSFDQRYFGIHEICIFGAQSAALLHEYGYALNIVPLKHSDITGLLQFSYADAQSKHDVRSMTADALTEVIAVYEEKREPRTGINNGMETLAVLEALSASVRQNGARVTVEYTV